MSILKCALYWIWGLCWDCILNTIGVIVALTLLISGHKPYIHGWGIYFTIGRGWGGLELGNFFLVNKNPSVQLLHHEFGHGIQGLIWGPLTPIIITIPSAIRYWYRRFFGAKTPYDSIWFEGQATRWGTRTYERMHRA